MEKRRMMYSSSKSVNWCGLGTSRRTKLHQLWLSGVYCCRLDGLELAARLSPWSIA